MHHLVHILFLSVPLVWKSHFPSEKSHIYAFSHFENRCHASIPIRYTHVEPPFPPSDSYSQKEKPVHNRLLPLNFPYVLIPLTLAAILAVSPLMEQLSHHQMQFLVLPQFYDLVISVHDLMKNDLLRHSHPLLSNSPHFHC